MNRNENIRQMQLFVFKCVKNKQTVEMLRVQIITLWFVEEYLL